MSGWSASGGAERTRLVRSLGLRDTVVLGLGSMLGAGVFAALGPAAAAAGSGLLVALAVAAGIAFCNATSSAQLAAVLPTSGGTYAYGRALLGRPWGVLAGWAFVSGKVASCAAIALTFGSYAAPSAARWLAVAATVGVTALNVAGIRKTALATTVLVAVVLGVLGAVVVACLLGGAARLDRVAVGDLGAGGARGVLEAAGLLFFAFAGYARIATLGEEVVDPARTIPRAIPVALGIALVTYLAVAVAALAAAGAPALAASEAPLATAVRAGDLAGVAPLVRLGAAVASLGVLVSLVAGVGRTTFAMAADRELPAGLAAVHPRTAVPGRAQVVVGVAVVAVVSVADVRGAIGFSSFLVLVYYGIANLAALRLRPEDRRWPRGLAVIGVACCAVVAASLPWRSVAGGLAVLAAGALVWGCSAGRRPAGDG